MKYLIINGPNMNILDQREAIYDQISYAQLQEHTGSKLKKLNIPAELEWFQSNSESELIDKIQSVLKQPVDGLVTNLAGYSHTSVALRDALACIKVPKIEVHMSNVFQREPFRHNLLTAGAVDFIMKGFGKDVYYLAVQCLAAKRSSY